MMRELLTFLILLITPFCFAQEKFKGGVSFDFDKENSSKAEEIQDKLPVLDTKFVDLYYSINFKPLNMLSSEDFKEKKHFKRIQAVNMNPSKDYEISLETGKASGKTTKLSEIEALLKTRPNDEELLFAYSIQLKNEQKYKEALEVADNIVNTNPDFALAHFLRGDILRSVGKLKEAAEEYIYTAQLNPYCADAYYNVAKILELLDNKELALDYYKTAYQINPNDTEIRDIILNSYVDFVVDD